MKSNAATQMQESATLKAGQGFAKWHVQIEQQKIDDVMVQDAVGHIPQHAGGEQADGEARPVLPKRAAQGEERPARQRDRGKHDEHSVLLAEGTEGRAGIAPMHEGKETRHHRASPLSKGSFLQHGEFRGLIQRVEKRDRRRRGRRAKAERSSYRRGSADTTSSQRAHRSGCAALLPDVLAIPPAALALEKRRARQRSGRWPGRAPDAVSSG